MNKTKKTWQSCLTIGMILSGLSLFLAAEAGNRTPFVKPLPYLHKPDSMVILNHRLVVTDGEKVYMYSPENLNLFSQFGKRGAGPGEFIPYPEIQIHGKIKVSQSGDEILVGSRAKVSRFTATGDFIKDRRTADTNAYGLTRCGNGFVGFEVVRFPNWRLLFYLYDDIGRKTRKLCEIDERLHLEKNPEKRLKMVFKDLLTCGPEFRVFAKNIYISGRDGRYIDVFNTKGDLVFSIDCDFPGGKISRLEKENIWRLYRQNKEDIWPQAKKIITVPERYPRFRTFQITGEKIYVQTYKKAGQNTEFIVLNLKGKKIKKMQVPLVYKNIVAPYPYVIHDGRLFTLIENQDTGDWEIHLINI